MAFKNLTGFGGCNTCSLCKAISHRVGEGFINSGGLDNACKRCHIMVSTGKECIEDDRFDELFGNKPSKQLIEIIHKIAADMEQFIDENDL
jgi:hypothetical protein